MSFLGFHFPLQRRNWYKRKQAHLFHRVLPLDVCVYVWVIFLPWWQNPNTSGADPSSFFSHIIYVPRKHQECKSFPHSLIPATTGPGDSSTCSVQWLNVREIEVWLFYLEDTHIGHYYSIVIVFNKYIFHKSISVRQRCSHLRKRNRKKVWLAQY